MSSSHLQRIALPAVLCLLSLAPFGELLPPAAAQQQQPAQPIPSTPVSPSFRQIGLYALEMDGKPVADAGFFHSQASGTILIQTSQLSTLVELQPRGRVLLTHTPDGFHRNRDGTLDRLPRAKPVSSATFELVDSLPRFELGGHRFVVREKEPLLGPQTAASLIEYDPTYGLRAQLYEPQDPYLDVLKQVTEPIVVRVFLGTWCTVCTELMPNVLRVDQELQGSKVRFEYYGIPRDYDDPEVKKLGITNLPTGIVYVGGQELQRIVGYSWRFPDMSLHNLVLRTSPPAGP
jgi:thiol-disulfide isomerase/thioredoxin